VSFVYEEIKLLVTTNERLKIQQYGVIGLKQEH